MQEQMIWAVRYSSGGEGDFYESIYDNRYFLSEESATALCLELVESKLYWLADDPAAPGYASCVEVVSFKVES